ncbi:hypothetical protein BABINDRAFT_160842 [Babjeviella inositovora NRRL Y-12698]|uniref:MARVEL domain-containing protein n=1 Tax=Babjeviella inositovora NRRL Y-12698 TaxID=984486 RepID=A0A1E3QSD9_9ASCO|nr:uncharacterized protein BABINDRAFT_160842 [Babjeviella inositovora NRRL Y-12698]ODQ80580.1 hypothetical protein BABINDRAFT_160842 [Babjeviella inositovora NRRL Y-12698]
MATAASTLKTFTPYARGILAVSSGAISIAYLLWVILGTSFFPILVPAGLVVLLEGILSLLWLATFFSIADLWGSGSCGGFTAGCKVGKAIIAFSAFSWVAFLVAFMIVLTNYICLGKSPYGGYFFNELSKGGLSMLEPGDLTKEVAIDPEASMPQVNDENQSEPLEVVNLSVPVDSVEFLSRELAL